MKIEESPAKQQAVRRHIEQVVEKKISQLDKIYQSKKEENIKKNFEKKKNEVTRTLKPLLDSLKKNEETLIREAEKINYSLGTFHSWGYNDDSRISVPEIKEENIKNAIGEDFEKTNSDKKEELQEKIENKKLEIVEKILFADEKELIKLISELKEIKIEL